jgi:hypothetical protein
VELAEPWGIQLRSPPIDRLRSGSFCRYGAGPTPLGEEEQPRPAVALVRLAHDVSVVDEVFDELTRGLLGYPEVLGHVGSGGVPFTDPRKGEAMGRPNVFKSTTSKTLLYPVYKLAGQAQYGNGRRPAVACHGIHLDMD